MIRRPRTCPTGCASTLLLLLLLVIQITVQVRAAAANNNDDDDPCSVYDSCSSCTFAKFRASAYSTNDVPLRPHPKHYNPIWWDWKERIQNYFSRSNSNNNDNKLKGRLECRWCIHSNECYSPSWSPDDYCTANHHSISNAIPKIMSVDYQYDCPLGPTPYPDDPPSLLPNWMGEFYQAGVLSEVTLVDLSLPGTHDSLSYDLSLTVSEDGIDHLQRLAQLLHTLSGGMIKLLPGDLEEFFRMQGKTQQLDLIQQLDNGIRFLDFRIMYEPDKHSWYSIHFMQSKHHAEEYLQAIRTWLDDHPHEVLVIWLSKHGSTDAKGNSAYPGVSIDQKRQFWNKYTQAFDGLLQNSNETSIFTSSIADLIENNHRIVSFVSDYAEFTDSSAYALDAAKIQNSYDEKDGVFDEVTMLQSHLNYFKQARANNAQLNAYGGFSLLAMNTASPSWQILSAAKRIFLHWMFLPTNNNDNNRIESEEEEEGHQLLRAATTTQEEDDPHGASTATSHEAPAQPLGSLLFHTCSHHIKIPGVNHWCPENLLDISQLTSYYNQIAIEEAYRNSFDHPPPDVVDMVVHHNSHNNQRYYHRAAFPNAFYLDALDYDGTIRIGPQLLDGTERGDMANNDTLPNKAARYALVDTILSYNAQIACQQRRTTNSDGCEALMDKIYVRRSKYALNRWEEPPLGRHDNWPPYKFHDDEEEERQHQSYNAMTKT